MTKEEACNICEKYIESIFKYNESKKYNKGRVNMGASPNISPKEAEALTMAINALRESIKK